MVDHPDDVPELDAPGSVTGTVDAQQLSLPFAWTGGHGTVAKEQNTQQSPRFGRSSVPQPVQS